jgi:hypothetical protein
VTVHASTYRNRKITGTSVWTASFQTIFEFMTTTVQSSIVNSHTAAVDV